MAAGSTPPRPRRAPAASRRSTRRTFRQTGPTGGIGLHERLKRDGGLFEHFTPLPGDGRQEGRPGQSASGRPPAWPKRSDQKFHVELVANNPAQVLPHLVRRLQRRAHVVPRWSTPAISGVPPVDLAAALDETRDLVVSRPRPRRRPVRPRPARRDAGSWSIRRHRFEVAEFGPGTRLHFDARRATLFIEAYTLFTRAPRSDNSSNGILAVDHLGLHPRRPTGRSGASPGSRSAQRPSSAIEPPL